MPAFRPCGSMLSRERMNIAFDFANASGITGAPLVGTRRGRSFGATSSKKVAPSLAALKVKVTALQRVSEASL